MLHPPIHACQEDDEEDKAYSSPTASRDNPLLNERKITEVLKTVEREAASKNLKAAAQAVKFANRAASLSLNTSQPSL